jgi:hypothetical protein
MYVFSRFDVKGLYVTLDAERRARGLSWIDLAAEINEPLDGTPSIPISVATIRGIPTKPSVTSTVVLQVLRWLRRSPESFLTGGSAARSPEVMLPEPGPSRVLRLDTKALHAALDAERKTRGLTWEEVASELPGLTVSMLRNLSTGPLIGFPRVMMLTQWLRLPISNFVRDHTR